MTYNANQSRFSLDDKGVEKLATPTNGGMQPLTYIEIYFGNLFRFMEY